MGALKLTYQYNQEVLPKTPYFFLKVQGKNKPTSKNGLNCFPFGMLLPGRNSSDDSYRYGFNGYEGDGEINGEGNSYTTFYRLYDSRIMRWATPDPLSQFYGSQYSAFANNPIINTDPNGGWVPKEQEGTTVDCDTGEKQKTGFLVLIREEGDDASSLADFLDITDEEAQRMFENMGAKKLSDGSTAEYVIPDDDVSHSINAIIHESFNPTGNDYVDDLIPDAWESNYNCFESACSLAEGDQIDYDNIKSTISFNNTVGDNSLYENVSGSPENYQYGKTLVRFTNYDMIGNESGSSAHAATYLGTGADGTEYYWTKNGDVVGPQIWTKDQIENFYGPSQGLEKGKTDGYYNYKGQ